MNKITLQENEIGDIESLLKAITERYESVEDSGFLSEAAIFAHDLPRRLRARILEFRQKEPASGLLVIAGYPLDDGVIGPTPKSWDYQRTRTKTLREEIYLVLIGFLLGEPIAWATQQGGYLVHDILPIQGREHEQIGFSSEEPLWWHTEDAFHPFRGDYLAMFCLRNPDNVATTVGSFAGIELEAWCRELLFQPRYFIRPDESHLLANSPKERGLDRELQQVYDQMDEWFCAPPRVSVLFGARDAPYMRLDPYFMGGLEKDPEAARALSAMSTAMEANLQDVVIHPGEVCVIDNYQAVHGRRSFRARYDGNDRWLKRINVARDLRRSREVRSDAESRVIR